MNTRYLVEWTPWETALAAARKAGMPADGEASDYVTFDDYETARAFPTFPLALAYARKVEPADTWRCPRIRRQYLAANDTDDLGNRVRPMPDWETEATWEVMSDYVPVESSPDY